MTDDHTASSGETAPGDDAAVSALLQQNLSELRAFVRLRMGPLVRAKESSADLAQSVYRDILEQADRFQFGGAIGFKRWLYRTALRKILDRQEYYHAAKRDVGREAAPPKQPADSERDLLDCYQSFCTPSRHAQVREEFERIESAFDRLPEQDRDIILKARVLGLSRAEIGAEIGVADGAVRNRLARAMAKLVGLLASSTL